MQGEITIRYADPSDAGQLCDIYRYYVEHTAIAFDYTAPDEYEFEKRIKKTLERYPYLVAERDCEILGYVYVGSFVGRAAYAWGVETSIYVKHGCTGDGIGGKLYVSLEEILKKMNIYNMNACIGYPETEDEYLTMNSVRFHEHMGFRMVGRFYKCGYKFGNWYDMAWMEKIIGDHPQSPPPVRNFNEIR